MKLFTAQILDSALDSAIAYLPGWSHAGKVTKRHVSHYPFEVDQREIFFKAKHRTEAAKLIARCPFTSPRDLAEWQPESPQKYVSRKLAKASEICKAQTFVGNFSQWKFWQKILSNQPRIAE